MSNEQTSPTGETKPSSNDSTAGSESTMSDTKFFEELAKKAEQNMLDRAKLAKKKAD